MVGEAVGNQGVGDPVGMVVGVVVKRDVVGSPLAKGRSNCVAKSRTNQSEVPITPKPRAVLPKEILLRKESWGSESISRVTLCEYPHESSCANRIATACITHTFPTGHLLLVPFALERLFSHTDLRFFSSLQ